MTYCPKPADFADSLRPPQAAFDHVIALSRHHSLTSSLTHLSTAHCPLSAAFFHFSLTRFFYSCRLPSVVCQLLHVIQITVSTNSPIFGVQSHETNQHDRFFICA